MNKWKEPIIGKRITYKYAKEFVFHPERERKGIVLVDTETFICIWAGTMMNLDTLETQQVHEMIKKEDFIITDIEELTDEELLTHESDAIREIGQRRLIA